MLKICFLGSGCVGNWQQVYSRYDCGEEIGSGGFGRVYSGTRIKDNIPVAIKDIAKAKVTSWAKVSITIKHHHI